MNSREFRNAIHQFISDKNSEWIIFGNIHMDENELTQADLQFLSDRISEHQPESLGLANIGINDQQVSFLARKLKYNHSIKMLYLPFNAIGDEGAIAIAEMLTVNKHISELKLFCNIINYQGISALANALLTNNTLKKLELFNNIIVSEDANLFCLALDNNQCLEKLTLYPPQGEEQLPGEIQSRLACNKQNARVDQLQKLSLFPSKRNNPIGAARQAAKPKSFTSSK